MSTWLWPDHMIGTKESRALREEHNALVNQNAELLGALRACLLRLSFMNDGYPESTASRADAPAMAAARAAIAKAEK